MAKIEKICGIDISKKTFDASITKDGEIRSKKFTYDTLGMQSFLQFLPTESHCVMESTGTYHCRLAYFLHEQGVTLSVVNPLSVKRYAQSLMLRAKTDKADSRLLISYGKSFDLVLWHPREDCYIELQQLLNLQSQLIAQDRVWANQLEAISHSVVKNKLTIERLLEKRSQIKAELELIEKEQERIINECDRESFEYVTGIPGIGKKTAITLIATTQGFKNFDNSKQLCSYFGLSPRLVSSGTSVKGKGHICKMGLSEVRKLLYMCSLSAKRKNLACRELYERLLRNGKSKKLALIAVVNKLLKQVFAIVKKKIKYNDNFYPTKFAL